MKKGFKKRFRKDIVLSLSVMTAMILLTQSGVAQKKIDTVGYLIKKNTKAIGGEKAWNAINSVFRIRGSGNMVTFGKRTGESAIILIDTISWKVRFAEGTTKGYSWEQTGHDSARKVVKGRPEAALWQARQNPTSYFMPLFQTRSKGHKIKYLGRENIDNINYFAIEVIFTNGSSSFFYINPTTFLIERNRGFRRHHAYEENIRHIETVWRDFRNVNGAVTPFIEQEIDVDKKEVISGGKPSLQIVFNMPFDDVEFTLSGKNDNWIAYLRNFLENRRSGKTNNISR